MFDYDDDRDLRRLTELVRMCAGSLRLIGIRRMQAGGEPGDEDQVAAELEDVATKMIALSKPSLRPVNKFDR